MKRLAEKDITEWKNSSRRKPLIIRGARQVGKTWLVENCIAPQFNNYIKIDLEKRRDLHNYFDGNLDPQIILNYLELEAGRVIPGKTLLFFDEIQACPRAITALRYFYEQMPQLHVIAAGSLLEFAFSEISVPVGRIQYLYLHPMTFYEYLIAIGKEQLSTYLLIHPREVDQKIQNVLIHELRSYFFVGGMPEAVKTYRDTHSMIEAFNVQSEIIYSYRDDFAKYKPFVDPLCLDSVLLNVTKSIGEQLKYTRLNSSHSSQTNHKAFDLLVKAKIIHKIPSCNPTGLPLGSTTNPKKFKAAVLDIGLMQRLCQLSVESEIKQNDLLAIYQGRLAEQFVAQELYAKNNSELFYWARDSRGSNAEVDFITVKNGQIYPVEVKSGSGGSLKSLHLMLESYSDCPQAIVLYSGTYKELPQQKLCFMPLYCAAIISD